MAGSKLWLAELWLAECLLGCSNHWNQSLDGLFGVPDAIPLYTTAIQSTYSQEKKKLFGVFHVSVNEFLHKSKRSMVRVSYSPFLKVQ